ncbi:beta strand repeat-containing protein [Propylenella binzhouense]|nr:calcium-binding protein [Propylenella binzhouense]
MVSNTSVTLSPGYTDYFSFETGFLPESEIASTEFYNAGLFDWRYVVTFEDGSVVIFAMPGTDGVEFTTNGEGQLILVAAHEITFVGVYAPGTAPSPDEFIDPAVPLVTLGGWHDWSGSVFAPDFVETWLAGDNFVFGRVGTQPDPSITEDQTIRGYEGNDYMAGGSGDDTIYGGAGADAVGGGAGNDTFVFEAGDFEAGERVNGTWGFGSDLGVGEINTIEARVDVDFSSMADLHLINRVVFNGANTITFSNALFGIGETESGASSLGMTAGTEIVGDSGANALILTNMNYMDVSSFVFTNWTAGVDTATLNVGTTYAGIVQTVGPNVASTINGSVGRDWITAGSANDVVNGADNNDIIDGGAGNDTLTGGAGNDTLTGGAGIDTVSYAAAGAGVTANLTTGIASGEGADALSGIENLTGSAFADKLLGNGLANVLSGEAGDDTLFGVGGNDRLDGGAGRDTANYVYATGAVTVNLTNGTATGDGTDTLVAIENVVGSAYDDKLLGNALANALSGGAGNDTLYGLAGDDTLDGGAGIDTANYAYATSAVTVNLSNGTATGDGTDRLIGIENLTGSGFDDRLLGNAGANVLIGAGGSDTLYGLGGDDTLDGGAGTDTANYAYATSAVTVNLSNGTATGDGADSLMRIENVTGSDFDDKLLGNGGANALLGAGGNDTLYGLGGDDTLDGGAGTDTANYVYATGAVTVDLALGTATGDGADTLLRIENVTGSNFGDVIRGSGIANQLSGGAGADEIDGGGGDDRLFGNADADTLHGGAGIDVLRGGDGDDVLSGGADNDWLYGEAGADVFAFGDGGGHDTVGDYLDGIDWFDLSAQTGASDFDDLVFTTEAGGVLVDYGTGAFFVAGADIGDFDTGDFHFA